MKQQPTQFCCGCGMILDEIQPADHPTRWVQARSFLLKYGFTWEDLSLQQGFCPGCQKVMETTRRSQPRPDPHMRP